MKIAIGTDHHGYQLGQEIIHILEKMNISYMYAGANSSDDTKSNTVYMEYILQDVLDENILGILISGTGIGVNIGANKVDKIKASLCNNLHQVKWGRAKHDMNVLCLAAFEEEYLELKNIITAFVKTEFQK
ncbi:MAG: RpiB/LacA/LacB family sugar-phosphate isomerase [Candidatus Gracilibacteria bacterium]|nr:RpiB/LacA/LacB family sugar-phosphate isomerase [Candidatus Gracilibacteria bacterium]